MPILQIRDEDGKFIPIPAIKGDKGKSAYEQAKEGGYKGTEEEFIAILNGLTFPEDTEHRNNFDNPHKVTASQVNALSLTGGTLTGKNVYFDNGNARITGTQYYIQLDVFDSPKDNANQRKLVLAGKNTTDLKDAVALTILENGEERTYAIYGEHNVEELNIPKIITGTYTGDDTASKFINLGVTPTAVLVMRNGYEVYLIDGLRIIHCGGLAMSTRAVTTSSSEKLVLRIDDNGFWVCNDETNEYQKVLTNMKSCYTYIAICDAIVKNK